MSKRLRYQVAASLDGFIAGPKGEYDWIVSDPAIDFTALYNEFDTAVMGRKTFALMTAQGGTGAMPGIDVVAFSRTLPPRTAKGVRVTNEDPAAVVAELKKQKGKDIWLFGGGELCGYLLDAGLVDTIEVAVMPVLVREGIALIPGSRTTELVLADQKILPSGVVVLAYRVKASRATAPLIRFVKPRPTKAKKKTKMARKARR